METITMLDVLTDREDDLRNTLRANASLDKSSDACAETLDKALSELLLRHNASCANDHVRQAAADSLTATARSMAALVKSGRAEKSVAARQIGGAAILLVLCAVVLCTVAVLLAQKIPIASYGCMAAAVLFAYLSGRIWYKNGEVTVRASVDPDAVWHTLRQSVETMDGKLQELCACVESDTVKLESGGAGGFSPEELKLFAGLLEALYAKSGEFALRQLSALPDYMESRGVTLVEYSPDTEHYFECFPTRRETATQRPAMLMQEKLLMMGKATKQEQTETTRR